MASFTKNYQKKMVKTITKTITITETINEEKKVDNKSARLIQLQRLHELQRHRQRRRQRDERLAPRLPRRDEPPVLAPPSMPSCIEGLALAPPMALAATWSTELPS